MMFRLLSKDELTKINSDMPTEAKYGEVFEAIAKAQAKLTQEQIMDWGLETCEEHYHFGLPLPRHECPECWKTLGEVKWNQ